MLDNAFLSQLRDIFAPLKGQYTLRASAGSSTAHAELREMVSEMASTSDHISTAFFDHDTVRLELLADGRQTGVVFRAVPGGHEFSSLLLAILNADGRGKNLPDAHTVAVIGSLKGPVHLTTYMSLSCTNCPDVVQALNVIALLNDGVTHEAVDGALFPDETERYGIQAVPTVMADGEVLHIGRGSLDTLLEKLLGKYGHDSVAAATPQSFDLLVAGGGPAGCTAAIYAARKGQRVGLVAGRMGGQVNETQGIENIPSVATTTGMQLAEDLRHQVESYAVSVLANRKIERFEEAGGVKRLVTATGEVFEAPQLIIATGASWRKLGVPGEADYTGRGVAFCPHCDGPFYKGRDVAVVGGGNSGIEAAIDLAGICRNVVVLEFMDSLKADAVLQEKVRSLPNVSIRLHVQTLEVLGDGKKMNALRLRDRTTGEEETLKLDGVFVQIGLSANSGPFRDQLSVNRAGEIEVDRNCRTSHAGVYAAGDVTDVSYKQIVIAMGEGAKAALSAFDDKIRGKQ